MVSKATVLKQLKSIEFKHNGWGRAEIAELHRILLPDEEIYECVNGMYEGGFALLVSTDIRVLLVDKKPLNYLTVEDMRFDMISEIDYNNRLMGSDINISSGDKELHFRSYNQERLRKLIGHVQRCMAEVKKRQDSHQEGQINHLEQINKQLQVYLIAQHQYQLQLQNLSLRRDESKAQIAATEIPDPPKPSNELADYLYAQSLLSQYNNQQLKSTDPIIEGKLATETTEQAVVPNQPSEPESADDRGIYDEGVKEIFGKATEDKAYNGLSGAAHKLASTLPTIELSPKVNIHLPNYIHPLQIAIPKLPIALRLRKLGKPTIPIQPSSSSGIALDQA